MGQSAEETPDAMEAFVDAENSKLYKLHAP